MNWINIETATLDSEEFLGSDPTQRATWLCLLRFCCGQENAGIIKNCGDWPDRKWQQVVRVMFAEVETESALWTWIGDDLHVWKYPLEKEKEVQAKREAGRKGGSSKSQAKVEAVRINGAKHNQSRTKAEPKQEPNGRERKGKEGEGKENDKKDSSADASAPTDAQWLEGLAKDPAFAGIDVQREFGKMSAWCRVNRKQPSRRRFINWLNRAERPMAAAGHIQDTFGSVRPNLEAW